MKSTLFTTLLLTSLTTATPLTKRQDPPGIVCPDTGLYYYEEACIQECVVPESGEKGTCTPFNGSDILFECACPESAEQEKEKRQDDPPGL